MEDRCDNHDYHTGCCFFIFAKPMHQWRTEGDWGVAFANWAEPLSRGLPPPNSRSLCCLSSTDFLNPPLTEQNSLVRHCYAWPPDTPGYNNSFPKNLNMCLCFLNCPAPQLCSVYEKPSWYLTLQNKIFFHVHFDFFFALDSENSRSLILVWPTEFLWELFCYL
jgi:hypothetical protein